MFRIRKKLESPRVWSFKVTEACHLSKLLDLSIDSLESSLKGIEMGIPNLKIFECYANDLNYLDNGRPIECPTTLIVREGEELIAKYKGRVVAILFKDGSFLKVRRKLNT